MRHIDLLIGLGLVILTTAIYSPVRQHEFVNYDDPDYVTANAHVKAGLAAESVRWAFTATTLRTSDGDVASNWFPLTWLSHMADVQWFELDSGAHHLISVAWHSFAALFVFAFLVRATDARWQSAFVAAVFALHPLHVESVAWAAERKDVLSTFFWFLTLCLYVRYSERPKAARYSAVLVAMACALMAKPMTVTLPLVLLLVDLWPLRRPIVWRLLTEKLPLMAVAAGVAVTTWLIQRGGGAVVPFNVSSLPLRLENSIVAATAYLIQTVWPKRMAVFYPMPAEIPVWQWASAACFLAAASAFAVREIKRRPWLAVGWFWYLVTLVPVIGIVQVGAQSRADRYTYIPMVGIAIIAAWGAGELLGRAPRVLAAALGTAAIVAFCVVTIHQLAYWQNSTTLFEHAIAVTRNNYVAYNNLGLALRAQGRLDEALSNYRRAAAIEHQLDRGPAWVNLSEALLARGSVKEAAEAGREAAKVAPGSALAHIVLGASLRRMGDLSGAEREYRTAIALESASAPAHTGLGLVLEAGGMKTEAQGEFDVAIALDPDYVPAHFDLGRLYGAAGRPEEAAAQFREAVRLEPGDAETHFNLGTALAAMDKLPEAEAEFTEAIRLRPAYASAHFNLATALANSERLNEAIAHFSEAVRIDPAFKEAQESLEYARFLRDRTTAGGKK